MCVGSSIIQLGRQPSDHSSLKGPALFSTTLRAGHAERRANMGGDREVTSTVIALVIPETHKRGYSATG